MKFNIVSCYFVGNQQIYKTTRNQLVGGAEIYLYDLSQFLLSLGHQVKVIQIGDKNEEFDFDGIRVRSIKLPGICKKIGFIPENYYEFNWFWKKAIDKDVDKVHLHYLQHAWPYGTSDMTATCHGIDWDIPKKEYIRYGKLLYHFPYKYLLSPFYHFNRFFNKDVFSRFAIKKLNKIVSVDSFLLRYVQSQYPDYSNKINVIYNYVDTNTFTPKTPGAELNEKYTNRNIILFPRNLSLGRGVHFAVEAMRTVVQQFPEALLLVVGDGIMKQYLLKLIKNYGLEDNITFVGRLDHFNDLPQYYNLADIVIIPTAFAEGTSLSCLEAMASAKPVITTNVGGLYDIIDDQENGLLIQPNADQLAKSIINLLNDPVLAEKIGKSALSTVNNSFAKKTWEQKYRRFFEI